MKMTPYVPGQVTTYCYDVDMRVTGSISPSGHRTTHTYSAGHLQCFVEEADGVITTRLWNGTSYTAPE
jgi:hypothetical protein